MTEAAPIVWIVTLNWNRREDTLACLESLRGMEYPNPQIVVVDNGSSDGSPESIAERWPDVRVISHPVNLGFAAGMNLGVGEALSAAAEYVLILNNDTIVDRRLLAELVAECERSPVIGIAGPKIYRHDQPDIVWFAGADRDRWTWALTRLPRGRDDERMQAPRSVNFLCGCCMLVHRKVFERIGLFDPGYFMYYEDSEFCMRAVQAGFTLRYVPSARMWHKVSASVGGEGSPLYVYYRRRSLLRFLRRNTGGAQRLILLALRGGGILAEVLVACLRGRREAARLLWRGLREGLAAD